jgi:hypothetical protein
MNPGILNNLQRWSWLLLLLFSTTAFAQRECLQSVIQSNNNTLEQSEANAPYSGTIVIPVVVHVVYQTGEQNISDEQVRSQIAVSNKDFRKQNKDAVYIPAAFRDLAGDAQIEFRLAGIDPLGLPTTGIMRYKTGIASFGSDDHIKFSAQGGADAWNRDEYLNIWVGKLEPGMMGYSSLPGSPKELDGVVISHAVFGTTANVKAPYNRGRTAVHEIGHWLGLRHIWGDASCGDDRIEDTPPQQGPTRGCPSGVVSSCTSGVAGNMYMNFMDFTNDECTNMFTLGQVARMRSQFAEGGIRAALLTSNKAVNSDEDYAVDVASEKGIFPNPAMETVTISGNNSGEDILIYTVQGQLVRRIRALSAVVSVNISELRPGTYLVKAGEGRSVKLVKR